MSLIIIVKKLKPFNWFVLFFTGIIVVFTKTKKLDFFFIFLVFTYLYLLPFLCSRLILASSPFRLICCFSCLNLMLYFILDFLLLGASSSSSLNWKLHCFLDCLHTSFRYAGDSSGRLKTLTFPCSIRPINFLDEFSCWRLSKGFCWLSRSYFTLASTGKVRFKVQITRITPWIMDVSLCETNELNVY